MNGASQMKVDIKKGNKIYVAKFEVHTRAVREVSNHSEYLENRSRGLEVTWQPFKGDLIAHP
jgi:hypothetical protein